MEREPLYEIANRANILHKRTENNEVLLYEDHRTILNVLYQIKKIRGITGPLDIIMFDNHDDFCQPNEKILKKIPSFLNSMNQQKLHNLVEFNLNPLDDDWVKTGMELNLIGNCFLFNSKESNIRDKEAYETKKFGKKFMYNIGDVWSALYNKGALNDPISKRNHNLWEDLGWTFEGGKLSFDKKQNYILDFDLDCFSTQILEETVAIPRDILIEKFTSFHLSSYHTFSTAQAFVKHLISKSEAVTMCIESDYCGGIRESQKIFNLIDHLIFDNELGE